MARLTAEHDALVIRLVYDGPPRSGKTTSLGALARGMSRSVVSPQEVAGRTLYFDWLEYTGGSFDGIPIRCQILSVPGQRELAARRRALLADADAIVFVVDSSPAHLAEAAGHLAELRSFLTGLSTPRPGVVVQANHRDRPDALPLRDLGRGLGLEGLALVESVATESQGIREAFVLAVRLALDRTRELKTQAELPAGPGGTDDPEALLAWLQATLQDGEPQGLSPAAPAPAASREETAPRLPDSTAPGGRVWPPVDGRMLLHSAAAAAAGTVPIRRGDGSWRAQGGDWCFHSAPQHEFEDLDEAKQELLRWAQKHAGGLSRLSPYRCIALTETGWGSWRLWQVVHAEESLRQRLQQALREPGTDAAPLLAAAADRLLQARRSLETAPALPCRLDLIAEHQGRPVYIGLLPPADWEPPLEERALADAELVRQELRPLVEAPRPASEGGQLPEPSNAPSRSGS